MPRDDPDATIRLPLLSALLDDDPEVTSERRESSRAQLKRLRESVRLDLQNLLNTRQRCISWPKELAELGRSVLDYGVPDLTGANLASQEKRKEFLNELAEAIRRNDPRFDSLKIQSLDNTDPFDRTLRFRVDATIRVETGSESAVFDFQLEPVSRHFE